MRIRLVTSLVIVGGIWNSAFAFSTAKTALNMEYSSYVRSNQTYFGGDEKSDSLSTAGMGLQYDSHKGHFSSKMDLNAFESFAEDHTYVDVRDFNTSYTRKDTTYTIGRKQTSFSKADEFWGTGIWQPRFMWDKMIPETNGLTGLFISNSQNSDLHVNFFVSPLYIPEDGVSYVEKDGKITSRNPWFHPPPPQASVFDDVTDVHASVDRPKISDVVTALSLGFRVDHDVNDKVSVGGAYAVKPINQTLLGYRYKLIVANGQQYARINIVPTFPYHHVFTSDVSTKNNGWHTNTAITYESPFKLDDDPMKITQQLRDMYIASFTVSYDLLGEGASATKVYAGIMKAWDAVAQDGGEDTSGTATQFEMRERWFEAYRLGITHPVWSKYRRLTNTFEVTYDRIQNGATLSTQAEYNFYNAWVATASVDLLGVFDTKTTEYDTAFVRQYRANDRVSMGLSYVY